MADSKFWDSVRDFFTQYPLYAAVDRFLDAKWGKRFLGFLGAAAVTVIGWIVSLIAGLSAGWKDGFLGASVALLFAALLVFLTRSKNAGDNTTSVSTKIDGPAAPAAIEAAAMPHEEIRFDYSPQSPLQHDWQIAYFDKRIKLEDRTGVADNLKNRRWTTAPDCPTEGSVMIDIDNCAIELTVAPNAALSQRMEFEANYVDHSSLIFVKVLLATRDNKQNTTKFIKFILGTKKPYPTLGYEDSEYTVEIDPPPAGKGWRKIILSLSDEVERSWGPDGWHYKELRVIRFRGKLGISPIRLY
jgi:hypothetical protein